MAEEPYLPRMGTFCRYRLRPFGRASKLACGSLSYFVPLVSDVIYPPNKGVFVSWLPANRRYELPEDAKQSLSLTYSPGFWATLGPNAGLTLLDNEGERVTADVAPKRVWPAFGQPGGGYEAIWACNGADEFPIAEKGGFPGGGTASPYHGDRVALWLGPGGPSFRSILRDEIDRIAGAHPERNDYPPWVSGAAAETGRVKITESGGIVAAWSGTLAKPFGTTWRFSVSAAHLYRVAPIRLTLWGYAWVDLPIVHPWVGIRILWGPTCANWETEYWSLRELGDDLADANSLSSDYLKELIKEVAEWLWRLVSPGSPSHTPTARMLT